MLKKVIINSIGIAALASLFALPAFLMIAPETYSENTMALEDDMGGSITILPAISMASNAAVLIDLTPTAADADFQTGSVNINVATNNYTGYRLQLSDDDLDTSLQYAAEELNKIYYGNMEVEMPSITSNITASTRSHDDFTTNAWGYSLDGSTWRAIPSASSPTTITRTNQQTTSDTTTISFAAKADMNLLGGYYQDILRVTAITNYQASYEEHECVGEDCPEPDPDPTELADRAYDPCPNTAHSDDMYTAEDYVNGVQCSGLSETVKQNLRDWTTDEIPDDDNPEQCKDGDCIKLQNYIGNKKVIVFLQDMTKEMCQNAPTPDARDAVTGKIVTNVPKIRLIDKRDWTRYSVVKLADGNCWMQGTLQIRKDTIATRNIPWAALGLTGLTNLDASNTNIKDETSIPYASLPTTAMITGTTVTGWESSYTKSQIAYVGEDATAANHNHVLYNWHAATATPDGDSVQNIDWSKLDHDGDPIERNSLCPKGWRMPNQNWKSSYTRLIRQTYEFIPLDHPSSDPEGNGDTPVPEVTQANINETKFKTLRSKPFRFIYTGYIAGDGTTFSHGTDRGLFWTRVTDNDDYYNDHGDAFSMMVDNSDANGGNFVDIKHYNNKKSGLAVRCLLRAIE